MYELFLKKYNMRKIVLPIMVIIVALSLVTYVILNRKTITVVSNGQNIKFVTYKSTIRHALENKNIIVGIKDKITPSLDSKITNGETVIIKRAVNVKVFVDNKILNLKSSEGNIGLMLKSEGIALGDADKIKPKKDTSLYEGMKINIVRVKSKTLVKNVSIPYKVITRINRTLPNTRRKVVQEGRNGEKQIIRRIVYENGKVISNKIIKQLIIKKPLNKMVVLGGYKLMPVSRGGDVLPYRRVFEARATAYWAVRGVGKTYTGSGRKAVRDPEGYSTIAVDKSIIPYGTKLFVEDYGFAVAADTGSSIVGNTIDVFFDTYEEACRWAVKRVSVYILK